MAPYPAALPRGAQEVSEEDAPVRLLQPAHPVMTAPNRITEADFDGWVEQRGSKFFTEWDPAYTPLVETHDQGQDPQEGIWLTAETRRGPLHLPRPRAASPIALRRAGRVPHPLQRALCGSLNSAPATQRPKSTPAH